MQLVSEPFDVIHPIRNHDILGTQLSFDGGVERRPRRLLGLSIVIDGARNGEIIVGHVVYFQTGGRWFRGGGKIVMVFYVAVSRFVAVCDAVLEIFEDLPCAICFAGGWVAGYYYELSFEILVLRALLKLNDWFN